MTVAELLAASRAAHADYRRLGNQKTSATQKRAHLLNAQDLRQQAHDADPDHLDPAWAEDKVPHMELMAFYTDVLSR